MDTQKISLKELKNLEKDESIKMILDLLEENRKMMEVLNELKEMLNDLQNLIKKDILEFTERTKKDE